MIQRRKVLEGVSIDASFYSAPAMISDKKSDNEKIDALKQEIASLKSQWPAHSVPAAMLQRLDDLEEELEKELQNAAKSD